jgi:tripartite-type tricarboxylate transporter receptor subunit TctC
MKRLALAAAVLALAMGTAIAQDFPSRPITLVLPFPAGGPTDTIARIIAEPMHAALKQPVIVENVTGAGGTIASSRVAHAAPDGYTLILGHLATHVILPATMSLNYDVQKDFEPIALIADAPQGIAGRATLPASNLAELITWMKANPGASVGSNGVAGPSDISAIYFRQRTGTSFQLVPYRGAAPLLQDLIGNHIDLSFLLLSGLLPQLKAGQLKAFAVLSNRRTPAAPDVPTTDEAGLPGLYASIWHGIWAPKGTPTEIVAKLNAAVVQSLANPVVKRRFADLGQDIWPREQQTPEALAQFQKAEIEKWWPIIKAGNLTAQ